MAKNRFMKEKAKAYRKEQKIIEKSFQHYEERTEKDMPSNLYDLEFFGMEGMENKSAIEESMKEMLLNYIDERKKQK